MILKTGGSATILSSHFERSEKSLLTIIERFFVAELLEMTLFVIVSII